MNSSTIRRLAADHASFYKTDLPPYYLFPTPDGEPSSMPDDLTQLTMLLTGPQGTPYADGVWRLHLRIPHDYPKSPPKASFKTKMWHPNVEESTGAVCLETLKRDWESKLTLRDILITISCLLIQPNPDSALNAAAGQLLQEDYQEFAQQARLMTSIHAGIPPRLQAAVRAAQSRGEEKASTTTMTSTTIGKSSRTRPTPVPISDDSDSGNEDYDDEFIASKENNPSLSPTHVDPTGQSPPSLQSQPSPVALTSIMVIRRNTILGKKRPLADLPTPPAQEDGEPVSCSERNIAANSTVIATPNLSSDIACMSFSHSTNQQQQQQQPRLPAARSRATNLSSSSTPSISASLAPSASVSARLTSTLSHDQSTHTNLIQSQQSPPHKRHCFSILADETEQRKENATDMLPIAADNDFASTNSTTSALSAHSVLTGTTSTTVNTTTLIGLGVKSVATELEGKNKMLASGTGNSAGSGNGHARKVSKARVGLRRL